ncbi:hypothetical protein HPB52_021449 [Rhipicephalus sanguineus]|uniref:Uncharacterized protein n=1 Tax=Rhipicephalus sanguineus TaxID=34632 RepID=A0A9D4QG25_RHISA|nr:hypothetical protein HPB52_021449 [Rhipicephalus sanguineus]
MVASTPERHNADKYSRIRLIQIGGKDLEVSAYETAPHSTCKGVIRNIDANDGPAVLESNIVNDRNPLALAVKTIKNAGTVIIAFDGLKVPNFVRYGPTPLGHRADVCPSPEESMCRGCGTPKPEESHQCSPKCGLCGGPHLTADKDCKRQGEDENGPTRKQANKLAARPATRNQRWKGALDPGEALVLRIAPEPEAIQDLGANPELGDAPSPTGRSCALNRLEDLCTPGTKIVNGSQPGPIESEEERRESR